MTEPTNPNQLAATPDVGVRLGSAEMPEPVSLRLFDPTELEEAAAVKNLHRKRNKWRVGVGYFVGLTSIIGFLVTACLVVLHLEKLLESTDKPLSDPRFYVYVGGHAIITLAFVWFWYQLLKMAERMTLPPHYIDQVLTRDAGFLRALLGVEDPGSIIKAAASIVKTASDAGKPAKHD